MPKITKRKVTSMTVHYNGKSYSKSVSYFTYAELEQKKAAYLEEIKNQVHKTFSQIAEEWQEEHFQKIEHYTASCYTAPLKDLIFTFGTERLENISAKNFQLFLDKMANQGYAKQTIKLRKIVMSQIFDYAIMNEYISSNPISVCEVKKNAPSKKRTPPKDEDIEKIKRNCNSFIGNFFMLLIYTGLRKEEALALQYKDFDFEKKLIRVDKVCVYEGNNPIIKNRTKSVSGTRTVPLLPSVEELFKNKYRPNDFLFSQNGNLLGKSSFDKQCAKYKKDVGITCTAHQLRHYFATICYEAGLAEKDTQNIMGHSKISLTMDIYTHITKTKQEEAYSKLNNFVIKNI